MDFLKAVGNLLGNIFYRPQAPKVNPNLVGPRVTPQTIARVNQQAAREPLPPSPGPNLNINLSQVAKALPKVNVDAGPIGNFGIGLARSVPQSIEGLILSATHQNQSSPAGYNKAQRFLLGSEPVKNAGGQARDLLNILPGELGTKLPKPVASAIGVPLAIGSLIPGGKSSATKTLEGLSKASTASSVIKILQGTKGLEHLANDATTVKGLVKAKSASEVNKLLEAGRAKGGVLNDLNPTKTITAKYTPAERMKLPLGKNMTTVDKTLGGSADDMVTVYRGTNAKYKQSDIQPGDFVTTSPELAKAYAGDGNVIAKRVRKGDILDDKSGSNYTHGEETIYRPNADKELSGTAHRSEDITDWVVAGKRLDEIKKQIKVLKAEISKKAGLHYPHEYEQRLLVKEQNPEGFNAATKALQVYDALRAERKAIIEAFPSHDSMRGGVAYKRGPGLGGTLEEIQARAAQNPARLKGEPRPDKATVGLQDIYAQYANAAKNQGTEVLSRQQFEDVMGRSGSKQALKNYYERRGASAAPSAPTLGPVKDPGFIKRELATARGAISNFGEPGRRLAGLLQKKQDLKDELIGKWRGALPTVRQLRGKEQAEFFDALDALGKGKRPVTSPKVKQAIDEWTRVAPEIRQTSKKAGFDPGDLGKFYFPKNYDLNIKSNFNKGVKHLVESGQAANEADAVAMLKQYREASHRRVAGHIERSRTLDLPNYRKDKSAIEDYIDEVAGAVSHAKTLGKDNGRANHLIAQAAKQGHDAEQLQRLVDIAGETKQYPRGNVKASGIVRGIEGALHLGLSAVRNATQTGNTIATEGLINTLRGAGRVLRKGGQEGAIGAGAVSPEVVHASQEAVGLGGKVAKRITAPGFGAVENFNRATAAEAGALRAQQLAKKAARGNQRAAKTLAEDYGITGAKAELTPEELNKARRATSNKTQFRVDPQDLPARWSSPSGKVVTQFKNFAYKQTGFTYNQLLKKAKEGDPAPLIRFLAISAPMLGIPANALLDKIKGYDNSGDSAATTYTKGVLGIGGLGLANDALYLSGKLGTRGLPGAAVGTVAGPAAGDAYKLVDNINSAVGGKPQFLERQLAGSVPIVGPRLANAVAPYEPAKLSGKQLTQAGVPEDLQRLLQNATGKAYAQEKLTEEEKTRNQYLTPEERAYVRLKTVDRRAAANYAKDKPYLKNIGDKLKAIDYIRNGPKNDYEGVDPSAVPILQHVDRLSDKGKKAWLKDGKNEYAYKIAEYQRDKSKLTPEEDYRRRYDLATFNIKKDYTKEVRQLQGMSKVQRQNYLAETPTSPDLVKQAAELDAKLVQSGFQKNSKFTDGTGRGRKRRHRNPTISLRSTRIGRLPQAKLARAPKMRSPRLSSRKARTIV